MTVNNQTALEFGEKLATTATPRYARVTSSAVYFFVGVL